MSKVKNQHFVPQFYLKLFSEDQRSIKTYNFKHKVLTQQASIRKQCQKRYFYNEDQQCENLLQIVEGRAAQVIKLICEYKELPIYFSYPHSALNQFIVTLYGRTEVSQVHRSEVIDNLGKIILRGDPEYRELIKVVPEGRFKIVDKTSAEKSVLSHYLFSPLTLDLKLALMRNYTKIPFITSDNPVCLYNQLYLNSPFTGLGASCAGLFITFPLNPRLLLLMYDPVYYNVKTNNQRVVHINSITDVRAFNFLITSYAFNNVYLPSDFPDKEIEMIERLFNENSAEVTDFRQTGPFIMIERKRKYSDFNCSKIRINKKIAKLGSPGFILSRDEIFSKIIGDLAAHMSQKEDICKDFDTFIRTHQEFNESRMSKISPSSFNYYI